MLKPGKKKKTMIPIISNDPSFEYPTREVQWWERTRIGQHLFRTPEGVIQAQTRIETFVVRERIPLHDYMIQPPEYWTRFLEHIECMFREHVSYFGLLIEDSLYAVEEREYVSDHYHILKVVARAICPTLEAGYVDPKAPQRRMCKHCLSYSFESTYHSGTCGNCGAPYNPQEFAETFGRE